MVSVLTQESHHGPIIDVPKNEMKHENTSKNKEFQNFQEESRKIDSMGEKKKNGEVKVPSITRNVDDMVSATVTTLDAALEDFNNWYDNICENGTPIKEDIFENIKDVTEPECGSTHFVEQDESSEQYEDAQEEVKSHKEQCRINFGFKPSRRVLALLLLSLSFMAPDVGTHESTKQTLNRPSVQSRPTSNMFELKMVIDTPNKSGIAGIFRNLIPLKEYLENGSCFTGIEC